MNLDARHDFIEHHLTRQAAVHRLGRIEPAGLEQLVRRGAASAPSEISTGALARFHTVPYFAANGPERGCVLNFRELMRRDMAKYKIIEPGMMRAQ